MYVSGSDDEYEQDKEEYYDGEEYYDNIDGDENPTPAWHLPNWTGNKCGGCVTRVSALGEKFGCAECDEYWDLPSLLEPMQEPEPMPMQCTGCVTRVTNSGQALGCEECDELWDLPDLIMTPCEGCELLDAGLGGENQLGHACLGFN
jgi:hypothetical protein